MAEDDKVALIDLDGTLADYEGAMRRELTKIMGPRELLPTVLFGTGDKWFENRMDLIKARPGFWRELPIIPTGFEVYSILGALGYQRMILTKGPRNTEPAWTEKVEWCRTHVATAGITITRSGDDVDVHKGLVYGKVLFDDYPPYVKQWLKHRPRGKVLMLEHDHNKGFNHPNVLKVPLLPPETDPITKQYVEFVDQWETRIKEFLLK